MRTYPRVKRQLLAYAIQYEDGTIRFRQVLECDEIKVDYDVGLQYSRYDRFTCYADNQRYTVTAIGYTMHEWPDSWQPADEAGPPQIEAGPLLIEEAP